MINYWTALIFVMGFDLLDVLKANMFVEDFWLKNLPTQNE
jgi:hypothetical protein